jgi:hydroxyacylglutathione hydrolase
MQVKTLVVGPMQANCFIIGDERSKEGAVIDPGGDGKLILKTVKLTGLKIKYLIATHGHFDHTSAVGELIDELKCEFLAHESDLSFITESRESAKRWGFDLPQTPRPTGFVKDGDLLKLGKMELRVISTPGHSPGSIAIHVPKEKVLFSGDTLFAGSIGRTDFRDGSMDELVASIRNKLYKLPDATVVYTGHGETTTIGDEKVGNMFVRE